MKLEIKKAVVPLSSGKTVWNMMRDAECGDCFLFVDNDNESFVLMKDSNDQFVTISSSGAHIIGNVESFGVAYDYICEYKSTLLEYKQIKMVVDV